MSGTEQDACTSLPYGDDFACSGPGGDPSPLHFTGQQHDNETGLDHFPARNYTSTWGVFSSPDPNGAGASLHAPETWDMYPYAGDSPGTLMDPSGASWCLVPFKSGETCISDRSWNKLKAQQQADKEQAGYHHVSSDVTVQVSGTMPPPIPLVGVLFQPYNNDPYLTLATDISNFHPDAFIWNFAWRATVDGVALGAGSALLGVSITGPEAEGEGGPEPDLQNLPGKIKGDMAKRGWTKQDILDTVQQAREGGSVYPAVDKATGGPATEYVSRSSGRFVVIDNQTGRVIRVSRAGMLPNYLAK